MKHALSLCAAAIALAACAQLPDGTAAASDSEPTLPWEGASETWHFDEAASADGGASATDALAQDLARDVRPSDDGRMYLLELYQKAIEERDALAADARALTAELERARAALAERDRTIAELERRAEELAGDRDRRIEENFDLAGRLTTAQIRRLQAEKALLESQLAARRENEAQAAAAPQKP